MIHRIELAEMKTSKDGNDVLVANSLGACIALAIYDPVAGAGGLLNYVLPSSNIDPSKARVIPCMFADTGIPALFREVYKLGGQKTRLQLKVAGGSQIMGQSNLFDMGKRNYLILRKIFLKNGLEISCEDIGGSQTRSFQLEIGGGRCTVRSEGRVREL
ncbi:unnamed protein product [marine sediment metagenome]|uniref:Chemoreceptor glutamine deamidase CheD n=1 Tax=marine sediment metagenome TaxID=412755 RepID=X0YAA3_9ZZZZ